MTDFTPDEIEAIAGGRTMSPARVAALGLYARKRTLIAKVRTAETLLASADDQLNAAAALATHPATREHIEAARADLAAVIGRLRARVHRLEHPRGTV
ncbi:MAG TPA: hypothetical protein VMM79_14370 [Longimicrobiales bacterium]|nr:hypothetical protein [Longimicrobiales bacterium]